MSIIWVKSNGDVIHGEIVYVEGYNVVDEGYGVIRIGGAPGGTAPRVTRTRDRTVTRVTHPLVSREHTVTAEYYITEQQFLTAWQETKLTRERYFTLSRGTEVTYETWQTRYFSADIPWTQTHAYTLTGPVVTVTKDSLITNQRTITRAAGGRSVTAYTSKTKDLYQTVTRAATYVTTSTLTVTGVQYQTRPHTVTKYFTRLLTVTRGIAVTKYIYNTVWTPA